jgi:hypothetical protein
MRTREFEGIVIVIVAFYRLASLPESLLSIDEVSSW